MSLFNNHLAKVLFILLLPLKAFGLTGDSQQRLTLEAAHAEFDERKGTTTYSGDVIMRQGSLKIHADKLVIYGKLEAANKIIATGKPALFQQTPKRDVKPIKAEANTLNYDVADKSLILTGQASLDQEGSSLKSERIEYDVKRALVKAGKNNAGDPGRVRMIIEPQAVTPENDSAAAAAQ